MTALLKIRHYALAAALAVSWFVADAQMFGSIDDLALIWIGGRTRPDWDKELFTSYLVHDYPDGHRSWLFDGFLMLEGATHGERRPGESDEAYADRRYSFGEAFLTPANKDMWEWLMHRQLGTYDGLGCRALDDRIGELIPELGQPAGKHKVVMMLPISYYADMTWGSLNGRSLDFSNLDDKLAAMKWYVDMLLDEWEKADFKNIELAGLYWLRESITNGYYEIECAKQMSTYVHDKGYEMFWIPFYRAPNYQNGKSYGIDMVYHQPNYVFSLDRPQEQLTNAIDDAYEYDLGMLLEFEGKCISGVDDGFNDTRKLVNQWNACLYDCSEAFYNRFVEYVDMFEDNGVFDYLPIGYYSGYQAVYDFVHSKNAKDQEIINRLASNIEMRHMASEWYVPDLTGVADVLNGSKATVYGVDGGVYVSDEALGRVDIFAIDGRRVFAQPAGNDAMRYGVTFACPPGVYLVRVGSASQKVTVK